MAWEVRRQTLPHLVGHAATRFRVGGWQERSRFIPCDRREANAELAQTIEEIQSSPCCYLLLKLDSAVNGGSWRGLDDGWAEDQLVSCASHGRRAQLLRFGVCWLPFVCVASGWRQQRITAAAV